MGQIRPHVGQPHSMAFLCRTSCLALTMCSLMWLLSASVISSLVRVLHRVAQRAASATQPVEPRALSTLLSALQPECDVDAPSGIQGLKHCLSSPFHGTWWWYEKKIYIYITSWWCNMWCHKGKTSWYIRAFSRSVLSYSFRLGGSYCMLTLLSGLPSAHCDDKFHKTFLPGLWYTFSLLVIPLETHRVTHLSYILQTANRGHGWNNLSCMYSCRKTLPVHV